MKTPEPQKVSTTAQVLAIVCAAALGCALLQSAARTHIEAMMPAVGDIIKIDNADAPGAVDSLEVPVDTLDGGHCMLGVGRYSDQGGSLVITQVQRAGPYHGIWAGPGHSTHGGQDCANGAEIILAYSELEILKSSIRGDVTRAENTFGYANLDSAEVRIPDDKPQAVQGVYIPRPIQPGAGQPGRQ